MRALVLALALVALTGCGHILRSINGEGTPHCKPKCDKTHYCAWEWTECSGPFATSCSHSEKAECREKPQ